ncbi:ergothioneine biosynthesis protein EgtB [Polaribacter sp. MED152]|uniref:ergothioneine biosynthesis protein EgtB n=1 Tax=Polaribacter sp. MED152 TaxID=313598 RepID=UPI000068CB45|nr:ergothioneine biosynthesis protein EgtB [Polaribacter sp. MED152]EAQ41780.1 hypothetical protein MED152_03660 [Polaribacter sp. MED152]
MINIIENYKRVRNHTEYLCSFLEIEDFTPQSAAFASPPKWHIAHTTWFFEQMILLKYDEDYSLFNKDFSYLFNSYYNTIGKRIARHERGLLTRPSVKEVLNYRKYVDEKMLTLLTKEIKEVNTLTTLGLHHEQQHQELFLSDLKYTFSRNPLNLVYRKENYVSGLNSEDGWLAVESGIYEIGHQNSDFCFDNELGKHRVFLEPFKISKALVTNKEYLEFIKDGGYEKAKYWLDDGWHWLQENTITHPLYWEKLNNEWYQYSLSGLIKLEDNDIACHISYYEAAAFAFWKGMRLPTEFEWEIAAKNLKWGQRWEWTNSAYLPYPNFKISDGAVGEYNGKFMINTMVLRGASTATSKNHSRITYRNFFAPNTQWQFTGIRLAI